MRIDLKQFMTGQEISSISQILHKANKRMEMYYKQQQPSQFLESQCEIYSNVPEKWKETGSGCEFLRMLCQFCQTNACCYCEERNDFLEDEDPLPF